eukprot:722461-Prorocentrum_minimum.AAC.1
MRCSAAEREQLITAQQQIRHKLHAQLLPILSGWCERCMREGRVNQASIVHAHLAYMHRNVEMADLDLRMVKTFLVAQMWLRTNYNFGYEYVPTGRYDMDAITERIGIDYSE